jgi:hypothetical protein
MPGLGLRPTEPRQPRATVRELGTPSPSQRRTSYTTTRHLPSLSHPRNVEPAPPHRTAVDTDPTEYSRWSPATRSGQRGKEGDVIAGGVGGDDRPRTERQSLCWCATRDEFPSEKPTGG